MDFSPAGTVARRGILMRRTAATIATTSTGAAQYHHRILRAAAAAFAAATIDRCVVFGPGTHRSLEVPKIRNEIRRRLISLVSILLEALVDDPLELERHAGAQARNRLGQRRSGSETRAPARTPPGTAEAPSASRRARRRATRCPSVVGLLSPHLLRRHVPAVPSVVPSLVTIVAPVSFARPKSMIFTWPEAVSMMLALLISRWTIPLSWAA